MKRVLFVLVVLGQGWLGNQALAAGCATGSSFDASCESSSITYGDAQLAGRSVTSVTSFTPVVAALATAARELPLIAAPSTAASAQVLDGVVVNGSSVSSAAGPSAFASSVSGRTEGITIAGIALPGLTTALIQPTTATDVAATVGGGITALKTPAPSASIGVTAIPEPDVLLLIGAGLLGAALIRSSRSRGPSRIASTC